MKKLWTIIFLISLLPISFAEDQIFLQKEENNLETSISLDFNLKRRIPKTDWTFGAKEQKGIPQYEFKGIWRYAAKEIKTRFVRKYRQNLLEYWLNGNHQMSWSRYVDELEELNYSEHYGWWNRSWSDSLPLEKGGAPNHYLITYGRDGDWIEIGPFTITHDLRLKISDTGIYFDGDQPLRDLENRLIKDSDPGDPKAVNLTKENIWENPRFKFKVKPSINININGNTMFEFLGTTSLGGEFEFYTTKGRHFANLEIGTRYDFENNQFDAVIFWTFLW